MNFRENEKQHWERCKINKNSRTNKISHGKLSKNIPGIGSIDLIILTNFEYVYPYPRCMLPVLRLFYCTPQ